MHLQRPLHRASALCKNTAVYSSARPTTQLAAASTLQSFWSKRGSTFTPNRSGGIRCADRRHYSGSSWLRDSVKPSSRVGQHQSSQSAFIALGSNVGDRLQNIENACLEMDREPGIRVVRTSALYETEPMYVEDQDRFLNGACQIETTLEPLELLDRLQAIENRMGRVKLIDKGPRSVDLDILLYGERQLSTPRLTIPHALMHEREFVLRPLCDIPDAEYQRINHKSGLRATDYLAQFDPPSPSMLAQTALGKDYIRPQDASRPTHLMSILNMTPDSFSDGGSHHKTDLSALRQTLKSHISAGATIIDIGGQSSRPNAPDVSAEEEIERVLPAIELIKSLPEAVDLIISVDTYRSRVAEAVVNAGAHIINDISAGLLDPEMLPTVARLGCTYLLMHMRGTPATMQNDANCSYPDGVVPAIAEELSQRVDAAQAAGIRRWRIILDPGIGFAKTIDQNLEIMRHLPKLKADHRLRSLPWLIGSSRKSFIGAVTGKPAPKERDWATAATITSAIASGADIVRVHNTSAMADVRKMADAIYRPGLHRT